MKIKIFSLLLILNLTAANVFEAGSSEDIEFFIHDDPIANRALMFYDEVQEVAQKRTTKLVDDVIGIFLNKGEDGRSEEKWVDDLDDGVNLMRVDYFKKENKGRVCANNF